MSRSLGGRGKVLLLLSLAYKPFERHVRVIDRPAKEPAQVEQSLAAARGAMTVAAITDRFTVCTQHRFLKADYIRVEPGWVMHSSSSALLNK